MPGFLEGLPGDTAVDEVFNYLYGHASALVGQIDELRVAGYDGREGSSREKPVPGTQLSMDWSIIRGDKLGGHFTTTRLLARLPRMITGEHLLSITDFSQGEGSDPEPSGVRANRGNEIRGDYSIGRAISTEAGSDEVTFSLQEIGAQTRVEGEPIGTSRIPQRKPIERILSANGEDADRLVLVSQGILNGMKMVELIRDGKPAEEALATMGRVAGRAI